MNNLFEIFVTAVVFYGIYEIFRVSVRLPFERKLIKAVSTKSRILEHRNRQKKSTNILR
jgi:hypothetical protein